MNEREEALRLVGTAVRPCNELTDIAVTISVAAKLLAEQIDDIEHALLLIIEHVGQDRD